MMIVRELGGPGLRGIISLLVVLSFLAAQALQPPAVFTVTSGHHEHQYGVVDQFSGNMLKSGLYQQLQHPNLCKRRHLRHSSSILGASKRRLQQSANQYTPPKFFISNVKAKVVNTYKWEITRESSATAMSLVASGQERKQMGFTLTYSKVLEKREYVVEGSADITNVSGQDSLALLSLTVFVGTAQTQPVCRSMPKSKYVMRPVEELQCPFRLVLTEDPGSSSLAGFVQTGRSRVASDPVPFSFSACASGLSSTPGTTACSIEDVGGCVHITDGRYIQNRYDDKSGTVAAGEPPRSQLFAVSEVVASTQGPPQTLPTVPDVGAAADSAATTRHASIADLPDNTWWTKRRLLDQTTSSHQTGTSHQQAGAVHDQLLPAKQQRALLQLPTSNVNPLGNQFIWPVPQVTGDRPPVGEEGKPLGAVLPMQICNTRAFQYSMIFGPLLPQSCGIYEVQNTAAAAYTDNPALAVVHKTYFYLTILCPGPAQDTLPTTSFRSLSPDDPAGDIAAVTPPAPSGPAQLSFASFERTEAARVAVKVHRHSVKSSFAVDMYPLLTTTYSRVVLQAGHIGDGASAGGGSDAYQKQPDNDGLKAGPNMTQGEGENADEAYDDIPYEEPAAAPTPSSSPDLGNTGGGGDARAASSASADTAGTARPSIPPDNTSNTPPSPTEGTDSASTATQGPDPVTTPTVPISSGGGGVGGGISSSPAPTLSPTKVTDVVAQVAPLSSTSTLEQPGGAPNLRVSILEIKPTLLTSYSWSLSSKPMVESNQFGNVTYVGCRLKAERAEGMTGQLLVGSVRIGNPSKFTDANATIIRVKSVTVTAMVSSNSEEEPQVVTAAADCKGSDITGMVQLMPWRRTNCSFEIRVSASKEGQALKSSAGSIKATAVVELSRTSGASEVVSSGLQPFSFMPILPPPPTPAVVGTNGINDTNVTEPALLDFVPLNSSVDAGIQNIAVGSCATFSAGIIVAEELPVNVSAEAAAAAELAANGTTLDGRGGKCLTVCGATQPEWEVPVMAPVAGYTQEQCGTVQVYCVGGIMPDNGDWAGSGRLSPAVATVSHQVTISGQCLVPRNSSSSFNNQNPSMLQSTDQTATGAPPNAAEDYNPEDYQDDYKPEDYNPQDYGVAGSGSTSAPAADQAGGSNQATNSTSPGSSSTPIGNGQDYSPDDNNPADSEGDKPSNPDEGGQNDAGESDPGPGGGQSSGGGPTQIGDGGAMPGGDESVDGGPPGSHNVLKNKPPIQLLLENIQMQQLQLFNWTTNLTLGSTPAARATAEGRNGITAVQLSPGAATELTLIARYTKRALPVIGKITGIVKVQLNDSAATPDTIKAESVKTLGVYFLTPCGGVMEANITGCNPTELTLPATCSFELINITQATQFSGIIMANVSVPLDIGTAAAANAIVNISANISANATQDGALNATLNSAVVNGTLSGMINAIDAANTTAADNATSEIATGDFSPSAVDAVGGLISLTFQSAPFIAVLTDAPKVELGRCVNVTSSFSLTAAGVHPHTPDSAAGAASLPQPVLVPSMPLPEQLCGTSELRYQLRVGPARGAANAGTATASFAAYERQSARQAHWECKDLQLTGASTLTSGGGGHTGRRGSNVLGGISNTWPVRIKGC